MNDKLIEQIKELKGVKTVESMSDKKIVVTREAQLVAVECTNAEQWNFIKNNLGLYTKWQDKPYCINIKYEAVGCKEWYLKENYNVLPFSQYLNEYNLQDEWEKYLIGEAVRRGFVKGVKTTGIDGEEISTLTGGFGLHVNTLKSNCKGEFFEKRNIFEDGKWAEIIPDELELVKGEIYASKKYCVIFRSKIKSIVHTDAVKCYEDEQIWDDEKEYENECKPATDKQKRKLIKAEVKNNFFYELNK